MSLERDKTDKEIVESGECPLCDKDVAESYLCTPPLEISTVGIDNVCVTFDRYKATHIVVTHTDQ